jgi:hypothetical protein
LAVSTGNGTGFEAVDGGREAADLGGAAAVANWLAIAIAASISRGEQVNPIVLEPTSTSETGAGWASRGLVSGPSTVFATACDVPASSSYDSLATAPVTA